jgi:EAL and modified HD-GYP domain-containing signal transduction protein
MEVYVGRQPIFDRNNAVFGYELLYRRSMNNFYEGVDGNQATRDLIYNAFFAMQIDDLTEGKVGFINFTDAMVRDLVPEILPKEQLVIEILEDSVVDADLIQACVSLKKKGYILALDDFVLSPSFEPLLELVDIIKIEFPNVSLETQRHLLKSYKHKIRFLAERLETREEFNVALEMGYDYFQGFFFSKPIIYKQNDIGVLNTSILNIIHQLRTLDPDYKRIARAVELDVGLSYKVIRLSNTISYGARYSVRSVHQALVRIGILELRRWFNVLLLRDLQQVENHELIKQSLVRAYLMESVAEHCGLKEQSLDYLLTGMFSSIDVLLAKPMDEVLIGMPLVDSVKAALMGEKNDLYRVLDFVKRYEAMEINPETFAFPVADIDLSTFHALYIEALRWIKQMEL